MACHYFWRRGRADYTVLLWEHVGLALSFYLLLSPNLSPPCSHHQKPFDKIFFLFVDDAADNMLSSLPFNVCHAAVVADSKQNSGVRVGVLP